MKRVMTVLMIFMLLVPAFATSKPSVDGRAVVADEGMLPRGLFAKTVGYLPGDSVSVTNPSTGVTINVLVLGSVDPSTGVAILLSPEAADKLFITKNTNAQVKITKRTGLLDETATGNAVISLDPDKNSAASIPADIKNTFDSAKLDAASLESAQIAAQAAEAPSAAGIIADTQPAASEQAATADLITDAAAYAANTIPATVIEPAFSQEKAIEHTEDSAPTKTVQSATITEAPTADTTATTQPAVAEQAAAANLITDATEDATQTDPATDIGTATSEDPAEVQTAVAAAEQSADTDPADIIEQSSAALTGESIPAEGVPLGDITEPQASGVIADIQSSDEQAAEAELMAAAAEKTTQPESADQVIAQVAADTTEPAAVTETFTAAPSVTAAEGTVSDMPAATDTTTAILQPKSEEEDEPELFDPFAPIILVPAGENPPEMSAAKPDVSKNDTIAIVPQPVEPVTVQPSETTKLSSIKEQTAAPAKTEAAKLSPNAKVIPTLQELTSGSYYIQIATLATQDAVNVILETYGKKYPMVLVPLKSGTAYQIMVGPLSVDEYGTVLARFKSYGYKDAFLRKIK